MCVCGLCLLFCEPVEKTGLDVLLCHVAQDVCSSDIWIHPTEMHCDDAAAVVILEWFYTANFVSGCKCKLTLVRQRCGDADVNMLKVESGRTFSFFFLLAGAWSQTVVLIQPETFRNFIFVCYKSWLTCSSMIGCCALSLQPREYLPTYFTFLPFFFLNIY